MNQNNVIAGVEFPHFIIKMSQPGMELIHQLNHFFEYEDEYNNWIQSKLKNNQNLAHLKHIFESGDEEEVAKLISMEDIPTLIENAEQFKRLDLEIQLLPETDQILPRKKLEDTKMKFLQDLIKKIASNEKLFNLSEEDKTIDQNYQKKIHETKISLLHKILDYFEQESKTSFFQKIKKKFGYRKYSIEKFSQQDITDLIFAIASEPRNSFTRVQGFLDRTLEQNK